MRTLLFCLVLWLPILPASAQTHTLSGDSVRADLALLTRTLAAYHPSLNAYGQRAEVVALADSLGAVFGAHDRVSQADALLAVSRVVAAVRDGHTVVNPYNQSADLRDRMWSGPTVFPFTFRILGRAPDERLVVTHDLTGGSLRRGTQIRSIDGVSVSDLIDRLLPLSPGDGRGTDMLRRARLDVRTSDVLPDGWPLFDRYAALLLPDQEAETRLEVESPSGTTDLVAAERITRVERQRRLALAGVEGFDDERSWTHRMLDDETAYVRLGSFLSHRFQVPADTLLDQTFGWIERQGASRLVLDVRGIQGGTLGYETVARYLTTRTLPCDVIEQVFVASPQADPAFFPYLSSWDDGWKQPLPDGATERQSDGRYLLRGAAQCAPIRPAARAFSGAVVVLSDAFNASATYLLLAHVRRHGIGAIVGQRAGGNLRGFSGGLMVMLTLPHTGIVVDIPLLGRSAPDDPIDGPLIPDLETTWTARDIEQGRDPDIEAALALLESDPSAAPRQR